MPSEIKTAHSGDAHEIHYCELDWHSNKRCVQFCSCSDAGYKRVCASIYVHGVPYEEATRFDPSSVVPVLLEMLANPQEERYWPNIVITLGMLGDERAVEPLIRFVAEGVGQLSRDQFVAKTSAVASLGYIVNKSNSDRALTYLTEGIDPEVWSRRGINWSSPFHASEVGRNGQLITMSILGLGLSGNSRAAEVLRSLRTP